MSRIIYKYQLQVNPLHESHMLLVRPNPTPLHVAMQKGLQVWLEVDDVDDVRPWWYMVCGTGIGIDVSQVDRRHIGTVLDDPFVWHIFHLPMMSGE